jgi:5-methylcytosine-specific restriction endonuclease McrA
MFAQGTFKTEDEILSAIDWLEYHWPGRWEFLDQYDTSELRCNVFGHVCPVFLTAETWATETKSGRRHSRYISREVMLKVVRRDGQTCQVCNSHVPDDEINFDHVIPHSRGGQATVENLRVLCATCNRKKRDSLHELLER